MERLRDSSSKVRSLLLVFISYLHHVMNWITRIPSVICRAIDQSVFFEKREIEAPITQFGVEVDEIRSEGFAGGVLATDFPDESRPEVFTRSTAILNGGFTLDNAFATWKLYLRSSLRYRLVDMTLKIETIRTHGMLHTPPYDLTEISGDGSKLRRSARILINGHLVDKIYLVARHPHGEDFGVDSRRPIPVFRYINLDEKGQVLRLEVDRMVAWDIDRVTLEPVIVAKHLSPWAAMVAGSLVSALVGGIISIISTIH